MSKQPITFTRFGSSIPPDVEIDILGQRYYMHSAVLRLGAEFFEKSLSDSWWKPENTHSEGPKYRYRLVVDQADPMLSLVEPVGPVSDKASSNDKPGSTRSTYSRPSMFSTFSMRSNSRVTMFSLSTRQGANPRAG